MRISDDNGVSTEAGVVAAMQYIPGQQDHPEYQGSEPLTQLDRDAVVSHQPALRGVEMLWFTEL